MVRAFSGYLSTDQLLLLWDRILGYDSLEVVAGIKLMSKSHERACLSLFYLTPGRLPLFLLARSRLLKFSQLPSLPSEQRT
ncbi:unnamed protein product [Menidia menidia]|uniref:(Atlantic silverside) hypothetical protein n=1 Tax=Menidia menidia TaxID=238744 RepID=A0A8S4B483_9TELE|nr:unnamed protein product [Menidia menidia]